MRRGELLEKTNLAIIIEAISNIETFEQSYELAGNRILEDVKQTIQSNLELDTAMLNDIHDAISVAEEKAFVIGICEGMKLARTI